MAGTSNGAQKAWKTIKRRKAARKAVQTRKRRQAALKAWETRRELYGENGRA